MEVSLADPPEGDSVFLGIMNNVKAFVYKPETNSLQVLDQLRLPDSVEYLEVPDIETGHSVIKRMIVRGAPCIAAVGCLSLVVEMSQPDFLERNDLSVKSKFDEWLSSRQQFLVSSRPTAVNLRKALAKIYKSTSTIVDPRSRINAIVNACKLGLENGEGLNRIMGDHGAREIILKLKFGRSMANILTHCNTGALATVGYGTALGVVRSLNSLGRLEHVFCTETRPYNQGSRLTAWELVQDQIPATLIADSMVAYLMLTHQVDAVVVGADCVAANGDTANKIGTYQIAILAKHFGIPLYIAAPIQTFDLSIKNHTGIVVEQRPSDEMRRIHGINLAPSSINAWNPCFDVTPNELITGYITEIGVCKAREIEEFLTSGRASETNLLALF